MKTHGPDKEYVCIGVKASNYFMKKHGADTLSEKGPGGGGWILMNMNLAVKTRDGYNKGALLVTLATKVSPEY